MSTIRWRFILYRGKGILIRTTHKARKNSFQPRSSQLSGKLNDISKKHR
jgi:hypothetical protein